MRMPLTRLAIASLCLTLGSLMPWEQVQAYAFGVTPIRVELDASTRSSALTVSNDDAVKIGFQMRLMRWRQGPEGKDIYEDSKDLVFFPRLMTVDPKDKRVIRVAAQKPAGEMEATYRLFIEELPDSSKGAAAGPQIAVRMRFAVPVFVAPANPVIKGAIENLNQDGKTLRFKVSNQGNRHFKIDSISLRQVDQASDEIVGGYVLAGITREFSIGIRSEDCRKSGALDLILKGDKLDLRQSVTIDSSRCGP